MQQEMSPMQQMIYTGQFGTSAPMQQNTGFNPYTQMPQQQPYNNMVQYNQYPVYNNYNYQPQGYGINQQNNNFVFQPVGGYQQPIYDYYNPYGNTFSQYRQQPQYYQYGQYNQPQMYQQQPYAQYGYNNYTPYYSPLQRQQQMNEQVEMMKIKFRIVDKFFHRETDEEKLDQMLNPYNKANVPTPEQQKAMQHEQLMHELCRMADSGIQYETQLSRDGAYIRAMSENMHKALDNHSLCQFLEEDLWRLQREQWIAENISPNRGRNFSTVYNSNEYNELLNLHRSSNPYVNEMLSNSRYDNNMDDLAIGMDLAYDRARRKQALLEGKVPTFISDEETQRRRAEWTSQVINNNIQ
jgi:hypothetical protein